MSRSTTISFKAAAIAIGLTIAALSVVFFLEVGLWLIVSDPVPDKLDVVFTFASERSRVVYSREMMARFPRAHWVLSDYRDGSARVLRKDGFDMSRVTTIDTCSSTLSEVDALQGWLRARTLGDTVPAPAQHSSASPGPLTIGLISSPYHMRRIRFMVNRTFHDRNFQFRYLPVPVERYGWSRETFSKWWKSRALSAIVVSELQKMIYFWLIS